MTKTLAPFSIVSDPTPEDPDPAALELDAQLDFLLAFLAGALVATALLGAAWLAGRGQ